MKLNRRGALMSIIGGIFGGPEAAKSVINVQMGEAYLKGGHMAGRGYDVSAPEGPMVGTEDFKLSQIKNAKERISQLTKILNGELLDYQKQQLKDFSGLAQRKRMFEIDGMRSISPTAKLHMIDREHKEYMLRSWKRDAEEEIKNLTGWLYRLESGFKVVDKMLAGGSANKIEGRIWDEDVYNSPPKAQRG